MSYGYNGKFVSEEKIEDKYRPSEIKKSFYCYVYPEETSEEYESPQFGGTVMKVRITPESLSEVRIAGQKSVYKVRHFNSEYCLLDCRKGCRYLIDVQTIEKNNLKPERT
ncbi:MAG: hypothetical protein IJI14_06135 [Anaerolineaceae bacterium]|nr:hypothetical protein [Anaerolineaceae bacterium]